MAVVDILSQGLTDRDASPRVPVDGRTQGATVRYACGAVDITNGDSIASTYRACSVPSNAKIISVKLSCPDIATTGATDVGLYETTANGAAVKDADFFGSAIVLSSGAITKSDVTFESGIYTLANGENPLWEALGETADTLRDYDVTLTLTTAANGDGTAIVEVLYTV